MSKKQFWLTCGFMAAVGLGVLVVWLITHDEKKVQVSLAIGIVALVVWLICAATTHFLHVTGGFLKGIAQDAKVFQEKEREEGKLSAAAKGKEYPGTVFSVWVNENGADGQVEISWDWNAFGQPGATLSEGTIIGFRNTRNFTTEELLHLERVVPFVESRHAGSKTESDLKPDCTYFYNFFVKGTQRRDDGTVSHEFADRIPFTVGIRGGATSITQKEKTVVNAAEEKGKERARAADARATERLEIFAAKQKRRAQLMEGEAFKNASESERQDMLREVDNAFDEELGRDDE